MADPHTHTTEPHSTEARTSRSADPDHVILELGDRGRGAVSLDQLRAASVTPAQVRSRTGGLLTRVGPGIFVVGLATPEALTSAALLSLRDSVLSHGSAGSANGLPIPSVPASDTSIVLSSTYRTRLVLPGVRFHRTRWLPAEDRTEVDGRPVTTVARTLCDLAATVSARRLQYAIEFAVSSRRTTVGELQACVSSFRRRGRTGSRALGIVVDELFDDDGVSGSALERKTERLLDRYSIGGWEREHRPPWFDGRRGTVDFAWPSHRLILEVDGRRWHTMTQAFDEDRRRDQIATSAGWRTIRASWQQVVHRPNELASVLRAALDRP